MMISDDEGVQEPLHTVDDIEKLRKQLGAILDELSRCLPSFFKKFSICLVTNAIACGSVYKICMYICS